MSELLHKVLTDLSAREDISTQAVVAGIEKRYSPWY